MDSPITGYVLMKILSVVGALTNQHCGYESLSISKSVYDRYTPERCSLTSLGPPHPVTHE